MISSGIRKVLTQFERTYEPFNRIEISRAALLHNLHWFQGQTGLRVIPVLKSNAYGHGIREVAKALEGQDLSYIAVDGYFEAVRIREVSQLPILIMGMIPVKNFRSLRYRNFAFVVHDESSVRALGATGRRLKVHIELNSGMNRYGIETAALEKFVKLIQSFSNLEIEGVMSHLADSDGDSPRSVASEVELFDKTVERLQKMGVSPKHIHVAQTAGSQKAVSRYANTIRLGIGLYGSNPFPANNPVRRVLSELRPALRLVSTITEIHELSPGDRVSYNYTFEAPKKMRIGVLPLGYYEGIPRALSNAGVIMINDKPAPIVGRVCMNHTIVELPDKVASVADEVVVFSNQKSDPNSIDAIAKSYDLFNYSLLTSLSADVCRVLKP